MARRLRVWVTRSLPGAAATGERLVGAGHEALIAPLLEVVMLRPTPPPPIPAALAFTSANAVRAWSALGGARDGVVFAVGDATAGAAREVGFIHVRSAAGDVSALAALIAAEPPQGPLLHPCALEASGDLAGVLARAGVMVVVLPLYRTDAVATLPRTAAAALADGELDAVLLHSPKAGRTLSELAAARPAAELERIRALGLSAACLAPLAGLAFAALEAAKVPDETALLARLG